MLQKRDVSGPYFGEGIVNWKDRLVELTWQAHRGFIYDLASFAPRSEFEYPGEGWGLTTDGKRIIMSDGTAQIRFWDPEALRETGRITVTDQGQPVAELNELEWVKGEIYANVYQTDRIARIDPASGKVVGWISTGLLPESERIPNYTDVLNGIAYDPATDRLFVSRQALAQALRDPSGADGADSAIIAPLLLCRVSDLLEVLFYVALERSRDFVPADVGVAFAVLRAALRVGRAQNLGGGGLHLDRRLACDVLLPLADNFGDFPQRGHLLGLLDVLVAVLAAHAAPWLFAGLAGIAVPVAFIACLFRILGLVAVVLRIRLRLAGFLFPFLADCCFPPFCCPCCCWFF